MAYRQDQGGQGSRGHSNPNLNPGSNPKPLCSVGTTGRLEAQAPDGKNPGTEETEAGAGAGTGIAFREWGEDACVDG